MNSRDTYVREFVSARCEFENMWFRAGTPFLNTYNLEATEQRVAKGGQEISWGRFGPRAIWRPRLPPWPPLGLLLVPLGSSWPPPGFLVALLGLLLAPSWPTLGVLLGVLLASFWPLLAYLGFSWLLLALEATSQRPVGARGSIQSRI